MGRTIVKTRRLNNTRKRIYKWDNKSSIESFDLSKNNMANVTTALIAYFYLTDANIIKTPRGPSATGASNELILVNGINSVVNIHPCKVIFAGNNKSWISDDDIIDAKDIGTKTKGRQKADIVLITETLKEIPFIVNNDNNFSLSIKKDNSEMWESADTAFGNVLTFV